MKSLRHANGSSQAVVKHPSGKEQLVAGVEQRPEKQEQPHDGMEGARGKVRTQSFAHETVEQEEKRDQRNPDEQLAQAHRSRETICPSARTKPMPVIRELKPPRVANPQSGQAIRQIAASIQTPLEFSLSITLSGELPRMRDVASTANSGRKIIPQMYPAERMSLETNPNSVGKPRVASRAVFASAIVA